MLHPDSVWLLCAAAVSVHRYGIEPIDMGASRGDGIPDDGETPAEWVERNADKHGLDRREYFRHAEPLKVRLAVAGLVVQPTSKPGVKNIHGLDGRIVFSGNALQAMERFADEIAAA